METSQTLIDSLTDHLALFHSSRPKNPTRNPTSLQPRSSILRWFSSLSVPGRCAALTILDRDLISVIVDMLSYLHRHGHCFFFLLTDAPSRPSVLYRRSRGLLARVASGNEAETELGESILLFSSGELGNHDLDTVTVSEEFVSDIDRFVEVMDVISGGRFLTEEENIGTGKTEKWPELSWLKDKGYYSLESYIANRLEIALRTSWREANRGSGGRKGRGGKGVKDKAIVATSGVAANVFWRKKGCVDWWAQLDQRERQKIFDAFVGKASTTMANEIVKESENLSKKMHLVFNHQLISSWETLKQSFFKRGRYPATSDDISLLSYRRKIEPHIINKLTVLYMISLLKRDVSHYGGKWLFFTTLAMAGSISDYVMIKLREVLMVISVEYTNLELLEDVGTSKSCVVVQNKGKKSNSKPRKPKSVSKSSKGNKLDGGGNKCCSSVESSSQSTMSSMKEEPKGSLSTLPIQQTSKETSISETNKAEIAKALTKDKESPAKKKNKRKGRKKNAASSEIKNLQTNRANKLNISVNFGPLNSASSDFSKEGTVASQVLKNSHNLTNSLNGGEPDMCLDNSGEIADSVTSNNVVINKRAEQEAEQIHTCEKVGEMLIPPITPLNQTEDTPKSTREPRHPFWEGGAQNFDMTFAPPAAHHVISHPPLALPFSYDWPPVYRNYDRMSHNFGLANDFIDDSEAYYLSEEEMDYNFPYSERGYNQFFGGGVMYWSPADYGSGNGNGSFCSDDSAWAWHEADVNRVIEEMTVLPSPSPSPSTHAASIAGSDNGLEDSKPVLAPVKSSGNSACGDTLPYMLRPINVPSGITRRGSRSELKPGQEYHKSPCLPSSARREPPRVKRPPSPVVLCVPRVPRPPPPSPVGEFGRRRAGGWPVARSGSSSPRNWGMRGTFSEEKGFVEKGQVLLDGPEVVWPKSGLTMMQPFQGTPVLQEHLLKITQFSRDQQHPDITLPLQPPNSINCDSRSVMHNLLHEEIDYFCKQVRAGNLKRKSYVTWAVNRVSRCLQVLWPRSRTSLFGSNATGLALPTSDVDLVISLPPVRNLEPIKEAGILEGRNGIKETCLQHAARHLLNQEWVRNDSLKTIENTAIPVIMLEADVPGDIDLCNDNPLASDNLQEGRENMIAEQGDSTVLSESCPNSKAHNDCTIVKSIRLDISFKSSSHTGLQTSELVRELIQQFPASAPLALVLKKFLADRSLDHPYSGGLSSYCLVLLITRFLQHEHHLGQPIKQNLGSLLMDFLYFFGNVFNPRQMRISIRGSGLYMNRERGHSIDPIHIDDPLYPANNVGRNCFRIHQCIKAFADAFSLLEGEIENMSGECAVTASKLSLLRKIIPTIDCNE